MSSRFIFTETYKDIEGYAVRALARGKCFMVLGEPGTGKTTALKHLCTGNRRIAYQSIAGAQKTMVRGLRQILDTLQISCLSTKGGDMHQQLCDTFEWGRIRYDALVVDEFQNAALDLKRTYLELNDKFNFPIIFSANRTVLKHTRSEVAAFQQIEDRIPYWLELTRPTRGDIVAFCVEYNVAMAAHDWVCDLGFRSLRDIEEFLESARELFPDGALAVAQLKEVLAGQSKPSLQLSGPVLRKR